MIRFNFRIEFLNEADVLERYKNASFFPAIHAAVHRKEIFIRITDDFEDEYAAPIRVMNDFKSYKFFHPLKMAGYKLASVMLWDEHKSSVIVSIRRNW